MSEIKIVDDIPAVEIVGRDRVSELIRAFLSGRNALTVRAYTQDLAAFAQFLGFTDKSEACRRLLKSSAGDAHALALAYRAHMVELELSPATINRRLAALRALIKLAQTLGLVNWALKVENLRNESYRDLAGPSKNTLRDVLTTLSSDPKPKARRDYAILRLLYDLGLRRGETVGLDLHHFDAQCGKLWILGKGRTGRIALTLPPETKSAILAWLDIRGNEPGPLFFNFDRAGQGKRLTGNGLYRLVRGFGLGRVHGLRHLSITAALEATGGDIRTVSKFSRHKDWKTVALYDDARTDMAAQVAKMVARSL